jgi:hypothetical protein
MYFVFIISFLSCHFIEEDGGHILAQLTQFPIHTHDCQLLCITDHKCETARHEREAAQSRAASSPSIAKYHQAKHYASRAALSVPEALALTTSQPTEPRIRLGDKKPEW